MEWEEHSLEACLAVLGLEAWDMTEPMSVDRLEDEEDWLDGWMKTDEGKRILEEPTKMNGEMEDIALEMESREMDDSAMEQEPGEVDYMTWLLEELRELRVEEDILECVRSMRSMGNCETSARKMTATMQTVQSGTLDKEKSLLPKHYLVGKASRSVRVVVSLGQGSSNKPG